MAARFWAAGDLAIMGYSVSGLPVSWPSSDLLFFSRNGHCGQYSLEFFFKKKSLREIS